MLHFGVAGLIGSLVGTLVLWVFLGGPDTEDLELGVRATLGLNSPKPLFVFPIVGTILAIVWTLPFRPNTFGTAQGILVSLLAFTTFCGGLALFSPAFGASFMAYLFFGTFLVGWVQSVIGGYTGSRYNKSFSSDASKAGAG